MTYLPENLRGPVELATLQAEKLVLRRAREITAQPTWAPLGVAILEALTGVLSAFDIQATLAISSKLITVADARAEAIEILEEFADGIYPSLARMFHGVSAKWEYPLPLYDGQGARFWFRTGMLKEVHTSEAWQRFLNDVPSASADRASEPPVAGRPPLVPVLWSEVTIEFTSDHQVQASFGELKGLVLNYAEFGFEDRRSEKPTQAWSALRLLAEGNGSLAVPQIRDRRVKLEKRVQEIRRLVRKFMDGQGLEPDSGDPIVLKGGCYTALFTLRCRSSYQG